MVDIQKQAGSIDCGVFAIAIAAGVALGVDTTNLKFNQTKMRDDLIKCFNNGVITLFPNNLS